MITLALIVGLWTSTCIQTQISNSGQGFVVESYEFSQAGDYEFTREWFEDSQCTQAKHTDVERGTVTLGPKMSGMFVKDNTFEADFLTEAGADKGSIAIKEAHSLKVARGMKGQSRNTMPGLFEYLKR